MGWLKEWINMPQFTVNPHRFDPYKNFKFRMKWDGRYVAGITKIGGLRRSTEVVENRYGGDPSTIRKSPGITTFDPIVLEQGITHDCEFEEWANKVWNFGQVLAQRYNCKIFARTSESRFTIKQVNVLSLMTYTGAGFQNIGRSLIWMRMPIRWPFNI